eukprot:15312781-Ditylum_brightwellii.AAC.1
MQALQLLSSINHKEGVREAQAKLNQLEQCKTTKGSKCSGGMFDALKDLKLDEETGELKEKEQFG